MHTDHFGAIFAESFDIAVRVDDHKITSNGFFRKLLKCLQNREPEGNVRNKNAGPSRRYGTSRLRFINAFQFLAGRLPKSGRQH